MMKFHNENRVRLSSGSNAFTLIEVLVVLFILLILTAIALPTARTLVSDQQLTRAARGLQSYVDTARNRAISEGREVGVLLERTSTDAFGRALSLRVRQLASVPPYSGDSSDSVAVLQTNGISAQFDPASNQLLTISASMVADPSVSGDVDDLKAPIRNGDLIELPGGRLVPFNIVFRSITALPTIPVVIVFDLNEPRVGSEGFPSGNKLISVERPVKYRIHRRPTVSSSTPYDLPRGLAIDFNYSGFGVSGNQLAPDDNLMIAANHIAIIFGPDGKVASVTDTVTGLNLPPTGLIFLLLGQTDGVRPEDLFSQEKKATANLLSLDSIWLVVNPSTGRVISAPLASVASIPPAGPITDTAHVSLPIAIAQARSLANLAETVDTE